MLDEGYLKAFVLKQEGKWDEAIQCLENAYKAGNVFARLELYRIHKEGGWGITANCHRARQYEFDHDYSQYNDRLLEIVIEACTLGGRLGLGDDCVACLAKAVEAGAKGCILDAYAQSVRVFSKDKRIMLLKKSFEGGSTNCLLHLYWWTEDICYLIEAHKEKYVDASSSLFALYYDSERFKEAAAVYLENTALQNNMVLPLHEYLGKSPSPQALYFIGSVAPNYKITVIQKAIAYYTHRYGEAQKATICWLMIAKRVGFYKDLARLIGKMIFASREELDVWSEKMKKKNKKQRNG